MLVVSHLFIPFFPSGPVLTQFDRWVGASQIRNSWLLIFTVSGRAVMVSEGQAAV